MQLEIIFVALAVLTVISNMALICILWRINNRKSLIHLAHGATKKNIPSIKTPQVNDTFYVVKKHPLEILLDSNESSDTIAGSDISSDSNKYNFTRI